MNDVASYHGAVEELEFLGGLPEARSASESALLNAARLEAQAHFVQAKSTALASQEQLAELVRQSSKELPPLPLDVPLVGAYQTKFEKIFVNRTPPAGLKRTALAIPTQHELLVARASSLAAASDAVRSAVNDFQQGATSVTTVLDANSRLRTQREEFLSTVRIYNESIVGYALAVGTSSTNPTLVAMLIKQPIGVRAAPGTATTRQIAPSTPRSATVPAGAEISVPRTETSRLRSAPSSSGTRVSEKREPIRFDPADARPVLNDVQWRKN